ncbi:COG4223 family protein [Ancylobacter sp.]|uniref:COG4223 family protein n=1 Tax=Ancylobacter sp. TaxID=1872567 RepID=UPI003C79AF8E
MATDDPNKSATDKPEAGAKPARRKPPTLDLSARDVTPEGETVSDDAATAPVPADEAASAAAPDTSTQTPTGSDAPAAGEVPVLDAAATPTDAKEPASTDAPVDARPDPLEPVHPVPPPAAPAPKRQLGVFGTLLIALISGVIGAAFAVAVVSAFSSAEQNVEAITELEARALDLRQRLEMLESRNGDTPAPGLAAPAELATRLDALESGLGALGSKVDALPATAPAAPAASPEDVAAVKGQVEALEQRVNTLPAPAPAATPAALDATNARLAALEEKLGAATAAQRSSGQGAAQIVVLGTLREAVIAGRPFATELKAAQPLLGDQAAPLAALQPAAATGYATDAALAAQLRAATAPKAEIAPAAATEEGVVGTLLKGAQKLVTIRRSDEAAASADLAKAEAALARGDAEGARTAIATLPEAERNAAQPMLAALDARQAALTTLADLHRRALATLAGASQ